MIEFEHYKKNLNTADKYDIKDVNVSKSTIYGAHVNKLKNYKSKEEKDANWQNRPLAVAVIGTNNTAAPLPNETEFWDPWTYIDNQELFLSFKPTCYIILGKPGAGSYVLGEALAQHLKCVHLNPKGILMDEIEQKSPTGICIHFNMGNDKVITFEMLFKLLKIKLESEIIKHRGYIISGFPLVTCSRNQQYLINSLYGEEGVSVVKDIMFDTIANLKKKKKKKPPGSPSISLSSASEILGEGGIEEEEEEEKEEELPEEEEELKVVLPEHLLDTCSDLIHPSLVYYNTKKGVLLQQLNDLFALNMKPDIIIYLSCPDKDLVKKNSCTFIDYKTHKETINLFDPKIPKTDLNRWPLKYSTNDYTSPYYSIDFKPKYNVRQPQKFEHKSVEQMCNYRQDILPFLKKKLEEFDPKFVLKVDARLSLYEMLHEITEKLAMIKIKPVYIPEPLYMEEPPDEPEEFWKIVEEQNVIRGGAAAFTKSASPWFNRCPVELKKRLSVKGNPKLAIAFLKHVYLTASLSNFISFYKNPRPFLKLKYLEPTCRIIVTGTKLSGKTMISECLSWLFDAPILNFTEIYQTEATKKYEAYAKTVLSEIIATIEDSRLTKWQNTEMERLNQIDQWCKSTITTLKKYIPLLKQYLAQSKENTEATGPPLDATFIRNFKKLRTSIAYLPFLDNIDECLYALTDGVVESYAPIELKMPKDKPTLPILGDDDVTEAITAYIAANDLQNEIIPNVEEIVSTLANQISSIDFEHQQRTNLTEMYGKYIIDGFPSEVEYWDSLTELNLLPDYTVSLIENREIEPELIHHYKTINNCLKNHQERYILAEDPFVKIKLKNESLPKVLDLDMKIILHEFVAGLSASDNIENTGVVEEIPLTEPWLSFSETIEKFKEGWDLTKIKLEENYKCIIEVQLENKTDIEIVEEILLKLRKGYYIMCEVNEDEDLEEDVEGQEAPKDMMTYNSSQNFGETSLYCPIAYYRHGVLWEGKPEFSVKFDSKLYRICNEANLQIFQDDVTKYQNYDKPSKTFPPVRICVIGCIGSGKTTVSKLLAKELGLMHIDFAEVVNDMLMPRHFKKVGRQYENSFADVPIDDEAVVEFQIDESNENLISDIMSNEMELRRMVYNYFERGSQIIPQIMQKLITKLWFEDPFVNTGFVLDGYPKLPTDIEDMVSCYCIPDIIIELECTSESALARLAPSMFKTWRVQLTEAREKSKNKLAKEKQEWIEFLTKNIVAKLIIDEILDSNFFVSEPIKEPSNESVLINANPSGSEINFNLFSTYNEMIQAFPEPVDQNEWEKADDARERIDSRLEGRYESDDENIQALKDILPDHRIKIVSIDGNKSLTKVTRLALSKVASLRNRNESFFEETFILSPDITELLISKGIFFLSNKFNRMCPVYIYENPNAILNIYGLSKQKNEVFPVAHRSYIYFIFGKESLRKFRSNPLKYIMGKNICNYKEYPLRISVIGAPKSGKSTLAAKLAKRFGLICFSRGIALRSILNNKYWTELGTKMLTALTAGDCVSMEQIVKAVQTMAIDHRTTTNGFVFDGFPETASEAMELDKVGLYPTIVFDITSDLEYISESSQKEIYYDLLKINPTHSRPFIENRFMKWKERTYNLRDWIQDDYQNLYPIDGNKSKWECIQQAVNIIKDFVPKVHNYLTKVNSDVVPVDFMCISNENFEKRISCYKHNCPLCLRENVLRHNKNPCNKKGIVQFRNQFYWICQKHTDEVMKNPHCYLKTKKIDLPELPVIVKKINLSLVYENGICIVTYAEHLPSQMLVMGKCDYACSYRGNRYMLCSQTCLDKFLEKPHLYSDITVFRRVTIDKPITLKDLPHIGYLEQTVAIIITEACISVTVHRPKYPGLSFQLSAILHIALYLKTHNPLINKKVLEVYQKTSKVYNARSSRVPVPDERYDFLVEYHKPASKVPAFLNVVDIAGLVRGAAEGQGLGNAFLSHIKACDAIFNLCRAFDDEDVIHVDGDVNPIRDLETIGEELRLKDEEQLMANFEKLDRVVSRGGDKKLKPEYDALTRIKAVLVDEKKHIRFGDWSAADIEILNKYLFLTSKPALYLVNLSEKDYIRKKNKWLPKLKEWIDKNDPGAALIPFSGVLENKLMEMDAEERKAYLKEHNITSALEKIIVQGYKALNLEYFFTAGADEVKAWTIQKGTKAPQAAGRIHTDFEKGFIMAEVMHFKDFKEEGSEAACKSAGKYRQQGRNYVVEDGDIIFFKFNAGAGLKDAKKK